MLDAFAKLMGYLHKHFFDSTYFFEGFGTNGARTLIYSLRQYERLSAAEDMLLRRTL